MRDSLQSLGDFTSQLVQVDGNTELTEQQLADVLAGPYLTHRDGNATIELSVRRPDWSIVRFSVPNDPAFLTITEEADGTTSMEFLLSDFIDSRYESLSDADKEIVDDPNAQYSIVYVAVLPKQSAKIINDASFTSDNVTTPESDKGSFTFISASGWGEGEFKQQPTTSVTVEKNWEGLAEGEDAPEVTFQLLANGEPAVGMDENEIGTVTFSPGTTSHTWDGLPTQLVKGEPITYTVEELAVDGFSVSYGEDYVVDLEAESHEGILTVTNTKDEEEVPPSEEPTTEPSETSTPEAPTTDPTTEPSEPSSEVPSTEPAAPTTEQENDPFGDEEEPTSTPTPVVPASGSSDVVNRCVNNAVASPLLWLIPVGVVAGLGGKAVEPYAAEFGAQFMKITNQLGMGGRFQSMFDEATRGLIGDFDPLREQRLAAQEFVGGLNVELPAASDFPQLPAVDAQEFGQVAGVVGVLALAGVLAAYWCLTPEGETLGAQLSS